MRRVLAFVVLVSCEFADNAPAQTKLALPSAYVERINREVKGTAGNTRAQKIGELLKPSRNASYFAAFIVESAPLENPKDVFANAIKKFEQSRTDTQSGASAGGGGTTSIVSQGVTAKALSVAAEYGAVTESVSGQVVTVKGSLDGIPPALIRNGVIYYCVAGVNSGSGNCVHRTAIDILRRFSYGVSFNTSTNQTAAAMATGSPAAHDMSLASTATTAAPVTFTASRQQISSVTGDFVIWNNRDVNSQDFQNNWQQSLKAVAGANLATACSAALASFTPFMDQIETISEYSAWFTSAQSMLTNTPDDQFETAFTDQLSRLVDLLNRNPSFVSSASDFLRKVTACIAEQDFLSASLSTKPVWTFEYNDNRPTGQPSDSTFRLIWNQGISKNWTLTGNFAVAIYDSPQTTSNIGRLRDIQLGFEVDRKLPKLAILGAAILSGSYYYQDQKSPVLTVDASQPLPGITFSSLPSGANQVLAQTGNIQIAQIKMTVGTGSSAKIPIAVSWSNRSELVPHPDWRAQIGISYDFDSLFANKQ